MKKLFEKYFHGYTKKAAHPSDLCTLFTPSDTKARKKTKDKKDNKYIFSAKQTPRSQNPVFILKNFDKDQQ